MTGRAEKTGEKKSDFSALFPCNKDKAGEKKVENSGTTARDFSPPGKGIDRILPPAVK